MIISVFLPYSLSSHVFNATIKDQTDISPVSRIKMLLDNRVPAQS